MGVKHLTQREPDLFSIQYPWEVGTERIWGKAQEDRSSVPLIMEHTKQIRVSAALTDGEFSKNLAKLNITGN